MATKQWTKIETENTLISFSLHFLPVLLKSTLETKKEAGKVYRLVISSSHLLATDCKDSNMILNKTKDGLTR
jgi:hypothetical protein